jgi:macrolide transport system ATP-binding/permease protein
VRRSIARITDSTDSGSAPLLRARDLAKSHGGVPVLDGLDLSAGPGQRIGLIGENGAGKTTLLRLLAGIEDADSGSVSRPADTGVLHQEPPMAHTATLAKVVEDALAESRAAERELAPCAEARHEAPEDAEALNAYAEALALAEAREVWDADHRAAVVLDGLGLGSVEPDRVLETLSGGQMSRLALAALLIRRPRALLLDEPTNHLDDAAVSFLEDYLAALPGAVVLASHDRAFLDAVCTGLLDLDPSRDGPVYYGGAYSHYLQEKELERRRWQQQHAEEQDRLASLRESVRGTARAILSDRPRGNMPKMAFDFKANRVEKQVSRRVHNARRRLERLEREQVRKPPEPLRFAGALTAEGAALPTALIARNIEIPGRLCLQNLDLAGDARLLVTGPNGAGKSTLLHVLAGRLDPGPDGAVQPLGDATVGLLEQDVAFPHPQRTPRALYAEAVGENPGAPRLVDLGLVAPRDVDRPVGVLSVGQRRRLALALLLARPPRVLLLDEPTNHLSLNLAEELEEALGTAPGAVAVASHDRWLRRRWSGEELRLEAGRVREHRPAAPEAPGASPG